MGLIDSENDDLKYEIQEEASGGARIKVIGVGGGGCNAVARLYREGMPGVEFCAMNTDAQALAACEVPSKLQLGPKITNGLGAGCNAEIGRQAALENTDKIVELLQGADPGPGAAPVIASLAKEREALTIAVVPKPFTFEGARRMRLADHGLTKLASTVDTVIAIPNDRLLKLVPRGTSFFEAFKLADDLLRQAVQGINDIINTPGIINRDFADVKATMLGMGYAMMGTAVGRGENAAVDAARQAINSPLLEDSRINGARGVLINITGSSRLGLHEVNEACSIIREAADCEDVQINFGVTMDESMADAVKITVIATGFQPQYAPAAEEPPAQPQVIWSEPAAAAPPEPEPEPVVNGEPEPAFDPEDLDTPAYLRQGRLLN